MRLLFVFQFIYNQVPPVLSSPIQYIISNIVLIFWFSGVQVLIFLSGLQKVDNSLYEAATVDGAGPFKIFYRIMLPNSVPILVTIMVFSFVWQWNDDFFAGLFAPKLDFISRNLYLINDKIRIVTGEYVNDPAYTSILKNAASLLAVAPLLILFVGAQRFFVENFERSGIVG